MAAIQAAPPYSSTRRKNIQLKTQDFRSIKSLQNHCIITNPPWNPKNHPNKPTLLKEFGDFQTKCTGSTAFVYFGEPTISKKIGLKPDQKWPLRTYIYIYIFIYI